MTLHSLSLASDSLSPVLVILLFLAIIAPGTSLGVGVLLVLLELLESDDLLDILDLGGLGLALGLVLQHTLDLISLLLLNVVGENDVEIDEQISVLVVGLVEGHTESLASHYRVGLDHLA